KPPGATDLQSWTRNDNLAPDWLRIGTDITHQGPFNATFSLTGTVPAPSTLLLLAFGITGISAYGVWRRTSLVSQPRIGVTEVERLPVNNWGDGRWPGGANAGGELGG